MRRVREVLRLRAELGENLSAVAAGAGLARSTVRLYLRRAAAAGIDATTANSLSDDALEAALFPPPAVDNERPTPDWAALDAELRRHKHVTRKLLWLEYNTTHPDGYEFSQFKLLLSRWQKSSGPQLVDASGAPCRRDRAGRLRGRHGDSDGWRGGASGADFCRLLAVLGIDLRGSDLDARASGLADLAYPVV